MNIVKMLNDALATEIVCVLRYRCHHFMARGLASPEIAEEFLEHSNEELGHVDLIARRIVELHGAPQFDPTAAAANAAVEFEAPADLAGMIRSNLDAEQVAIDTYKKMISNCSRDPTTRRMLEDILSVEEQHAYDLWSLLNGGEEQGEYA